MKYNLITTDYDNKEEVYTSTFRCRCCNKYFKISYTRSTREKINDWLISGGSLKAILPYSLQEFRNVWTEGMCVSCQQKKGMVNKDGKNIKN